MAGFAEQAKLYADLLYQVVYNLLDNAVKYTPAQGWIRIRGWQEDGVGPEDFRREEDVVEAEGSCGVDDQDQSGQAKQEKVEP